MPARRERAEVVARGTSRVLSGVDVVDHAGGRWRRPGGGAGPGQGCTARRGALREHCGFAPFSLAARHCSPLREGTSARWAERPVPTCAPTCAERERHRSGTSLGTGVNPRRAQVWEQAPPHWRALTTWPHTASRSRSPTLCSLDHALSRSLPSPGGHPASASWRTALATPGSSSSPQFRPSRR